MCKFKTMGALL
jgi:hypothetical protein